MNSPSLAEIQARRRKLEDDYKREVAALEKQIADSARVERANAVSQIRKIMDEFNLSPEDLIGRKNSTSKPKGAAPIQFRGPNGETWSGRGRQPKWLGDDREKYRVQA